MSRLLTYLAVGFLAGILWYVILSLPISPVTYEFFVKNQDWPNVGAAVFLCVASLLASAVLHGWIRRSGRLKLVITGVMLTFVTAVFFSLLLFVWSVVYGWATGTRTYPLYGQSPMPWLVKEAIAIAVYGIIYAAYSFHVATPTGIVIVFVLRRITPPKPQSRGPAARAQAANRSFQFRLRTMFGFITALCVLFAVVYWYARSLEPIGYQGPELSFFKWNLGPESLSVDQYGTQFLHASMLDHLREVGLTGKLIWVGGFGESNPQHRLIVVMHQQLGAAVQLAYPKQNHAIYVQRGDKWVKFPQDAPVLESSLTLEPGLNRIDPNATTTYFWVDLPNNVGRQGGLAFDWSSDTGAITIGIPQEP